MKENKACERRIEMEAVVDAYNSEERAMGWYYYLEERLKVPFKARCKSKREVSPLRIGEEVTVLGRLPEPGGAAGPVETVGSGPCNQGSGR